ncbi:MAG: MFS transporter [Acetobacteraceae bacterium]|nr:MFS transporter [Acetobacteraceae bacterium]
MPWALLAAGALAMFAAASSGTTRAPFLLDMARDLSTSLPLVADLVAATSISWAITGMLAGAGSDRWGRRPFLVLGPFALCGTLVGIATAPNFLMVTLWSVAAGGCSGMFTGVIFAETSARVAEGQQGRALGWVMSGQSLTLLLGVPIAAFLGAYIGWRGVNLCIGILALASAVGLFVTTGGRPSSGRAVGTQRPSTRAALSWPVMRLLAMGIAERICYGLTIVYFATFLQSTYDVSLRAVALPLAIFASGNILGTILGGQLADRFADRLMIFAVAMLASGVAALALFGWRASMPVSVGFGFLYVFLNAIARPAMMAGLAQVPAHVRGTVMGWNVTCSSVGWMGAAGLGGWMLGLDGFSGFGPLTAVVAVIAAGLALVRR